MFAVLCLLTVIGIPAIAIRGVAYRGAYVAVAIVSIAVGVLTVSATGPALSTDPAALEGAAFLNRYGFSFAWWAFLTGFGAILGACLFRPQSGSR